MVEKWGFIRETRKKAEKDGIDKDTGLHRTGLEEYLSVIFPKTHDWIHDKTIPNCGRRFRPDYRSEQEKLIIEFDGLQHYTSPDNILKDIEKTNFYKKLGYNVVRIPYFIQLTNKAIKQLFNKDIEEQMFNEAIPSIGIKWKNTPAYLCGAGIARMKDEFSKFPEQLKVNIETLKKENNEFLTGVSFLEDINRGE